MSKKKLFFILGPCVIENERDTMHAAEYLKRLSEDLNFELVFKSSFDKANRGNLDGFRGVGLDKGLQILDRVKREYNLKIITDIHDISHVDHVASIADILQIPAFLARQTDLLLAAGKTGKIINIKKGQFMTVGQVLNAADKVSRGTGNNNIWLCERGVSFGYSDLVVDYRNIISLKETEYPVILDATHAVQKPGAGIAGSSGGNRKFVAGLAVAGVSLGIDGLFMEVHEEPERALCDGPNSVRFSDLPDLIKYLIDLDCFAKSRNFPETD